MIKIDLQSTESSFLNEVLSQDFKKKQFFKENCKTTRNLPLHQTNQYYFGIINKAKSDIELNNLALQDQILKEPLNLYNRKSQTQNYYMNNYNQQFFPKFEYPDTERYNVSSPKLNFRLTTRRSQYYKSPGSEAEYQDGSVFQAFVKKSNEKNFDEFSFPKIKQQDDNENENTQKNNVNKKYDIYEQKFKKLAQNNRRNYGNLQSIKVKRNNNQIVKQLCKVKDLKQFKQSHTQVNTNSDSISITKIENNSIEYGKSNINVSFDNNNQQASQDFSYDSRDSQKYFNELSKEELEENLEISIRKNIESDDEEQNFYNLYKHFEFMKEAQQYFHTKNVPYMKMLQNQLLNKTLPLKMGLTKTKQQGVQLEINLKHYGVTAKNAQALAEGMDSLGEVEKILLAHNGIDDNGVQVIIDKTHKSAEELDLSYNCLTMRSSIPLANYLNDIMKCNLKILNLEGNKLGDLAVTLMLKNFQFANIKLRTLNLSRNRLTNVICPLMKKFLIGNNSILEIYLHWNRILGEGGKLIAEALIENDSLKILDLSYNCIGQSERGDNSMNIQAIEEVIKLDYRLDLIHLDLSHNQFSLQDCQKIAEALEYNHSLFGFHFSCEYGYINHMGYFIFEQKISEEDQISENDIKEGKQIQKDNQNKEHNVNDNHNHQTERKKIAKHEKKGDRHKQIYKKQDYRINSILMVKYENYKKQNCWICEGWAEKIFHYYEIDSGPELQDENNNPSLHLDFDFYLPIPMTSVIGQKGRFEVSVMIPPFQKVNYFYTIEGTCVAAYDQKRVTNEIQVIQVKYSDQIINVYQNMLKKLNQIEINNHGKTINSIYQPIVKSIPRQKSTLSYKPKRITNNGKFDEDEYQFSGWNFEISIFRDYRRDTEKVLDEAFENDYNSGKLKKIMVGNDEQIDQQMQNVLRSYYDVIKKVYKYFSSFSPQKDVWCISQNIFTDFVQKAGLVDGKTLNLATCDFSFIATNAQNYNKDYRNKLVPERSLVRHEFVEILVRLAEEKYFKSYICEDTIQATKMLLEDLKEYSDTQINDEKFWREEYLYTEQVDTCLKFYKRHLQQIYNLFAGDSTNKAGQTKNQTMSLTDLRNVVQTSKITQDYDTFKDRDVNFVFNLSTQTYPSEITSDKHLELSFIEFLEAFSRIAEIVSPYPYTEIPENYPQYSKEKLQSVPLHLKIEAFIVIVMKRVYEEFSKNKNIEILEIPENSLFEEELEEVKTTMTEGFKPRQILKKTNQIIVSRKNLLLKQKEIENNNKEKKEFQNQQSQKSLIGLRKGSIFNMVSRKQFKTDNEGPGLINFQKRQNKIGFDGLGLMGLQNIINKTMIEKNYIDQNNSKNGQIQIKKILPALIQNKNLMTQSSKNLKNFISPRGSDQNLKRDQNKQNNKIDKNDQRKGNKSSPAKTKKQQKNNNKNEKLKQQQIKKQLESQKVILKTDTNVNNEGRQKSHSFTKYNGKSNTLQQQYQNHTEISEEDDDQLSKSSCSKSSSESQEYLNKK